MVTGLCEGRYSADGGNVEMLEAWDIDDWSIEPTA
jgi:hypothetical protein